MSDDDVIDIAPRLRLKKQGECTHKYVGVDRTAASLTCDDCDAEIDPWKFIRDQAEDGEAYWSKWEAYKAACKAQHEKWMADARAKEARLTVEVNALIEAKNRLANEVVNGKPLHLAVRRQRERKT